LRIVPDLGLAEELAHDPFVIALEQWPESAFAGTRDSVSDWP